MFEIVYDDAGRTPDHEYPISSPKSLRLRCAKNQNNSRYYANNISEWPICIPFIQCNSLELFSSAKHKSKPVNKCFAIFVT